jgi:hypothetical protein
MRAARRAQLLYTPKTHAVALEKASELSAASARVGREDPALRDATRAAGAVRVHAVNDVSAARIGVAHATNPIDETDAARIVRKAACFARIARTAHAAAYAANDDVDAAAAAEAVADGVADEDTSTFIKAMWVDYDFLIATGNPARPKGSQHPNPDDIPVDPDRLGPLWPDGEPEGWPAAERRRNELFDSRTRRKWKLFQSTIFAEHSLKPVPSIEIYIDPGEAGREEVKAVLLALSDLHRAAGGLGLEFKRDGMHVLAVEEVGS